MGQKTYAGITVDINEEGYMTDASQWTKEIAIEIAKESELTLTEKHFQVIEFIRNRVAKGEVLTIRSVGKSGIIDIKGFYELFPGAPLKLASKMAGVPKPVSCV